MIGATGAVRVFAYAAPCDMRKSYEGLHCIVRNELGHDILNGDLYLFTNRRRNRAKVLFFDGTGLCIFMKRIEKGLFAGLWNRTEDKILLLSPSELQLFIEGSQIVGKISLITPKMEKDSLAISRKA